MSGYIARGLQILNEPKEAAVKRCPRCRQPLDPKDYTVHWIYDRGQRPWHEECAKETLYSHFHDNGW